MNITTVTRSPKTWIISYKYWTGNKISLNRNTRTVQVNSTYKPTRSAAYRFALDDLLQLLGHSKGQYGYTGIMINFISKLDPVLMSTKQPEGVQPAIAETTYQPTGAVFV
jgi:hypothetical protein